MKLGELGVRCCVSMHLYGEGERLSLTYTPGPSTSNIGIEREYNGHNRQYKRSPEGPVLVRIDREENMYSGGGMLTLRDPWSQNVCFLGFLGLM